MTDLRTQLQDTLGAAYTIQAELGGGGMSRVFVAEEVALARKVVVKLLHPDLSVGVNIDRFRREILVSAKLQHPHIVPVLTTGQILSLPYYTMPFVEGESLRARLRGGALSITEAVGILRDVAKALAYAHDHGVVHRDIKPDNILLSGGSATVSDFGIAKALAESKRRAGAHDQDATPIDLTAIGVSMGTPAYMAPEQAAADPAVDHRADIYSFGCVAYELLAGHPPFRERTPQRLLAAQMGQTPDPITDVRPDTPAELAQLVAGCLEKDADARPQSAADIVRVLETVTSGGGHDAMPPILAAGPGMLRKALMVYATAFVLVLIVAQAAVIGIGLPDWVVPGATVVMLLGLPVILFTGYVQDVTHQTLTRTPARTPGGSPTTQGLAATLAMKASPHVSWRRAALGGAYAVGGFVLLVGVFMLLRALGIGPAGSLFAAGKLDRNEPLLVADFGVNGTADRALGGVVAEAIRTDLGQSRVVSIMPTSAVRSALQRMKKSAESRLDLALARDLAQREGVKAVVHGDITPLGAGYIVSARLVTASTGDELASFRETADGPGSLIPSVEKLSRKLRARMGESLRSVRASPALADVTTGSLEALRKYTEGSNLVDFNPSRAVALLREAIAIDSSFAMAYRRLSVVYNNTGYSVELRDSAAAQAYRWRDRLTQNERGNVEGYYFGAVLKNRAKEVEVYEGMFARGEFGAATHNLGLRYMTRREYARAESVHSRYMEVGGAPLVTYQNQTIVLYHQRKLREADSVMALADERFGQAPILKRMKAVMAYERGQIDSAERVADGLRGGTDAFGRSIGWRLGANIDVVRGKLASGLRKFDRARSADSARGALVRPLSDSVRSAWYDAWFRELPGRAARRLDDMLRRVPLRSVSLEERPYFEIAMVYARAGKPDQARAILARYESEVRDTLRFRVDRPLRQWAEAEIATAEKRYDAAIDLYRKGDQLPDGAVSDCVQCLNAALGRIFDLAGQHDSAVVYFERYVSEPHLLRLIFEVDAFYRAGAHKRLGELYEDRGNRERALENYEKFVALWKEADPELQPKVADVRRRIARLKASERR